MIISLSKGLILILDFDRAVRSWAHSRRAQPRSRRGRRSLPWACRRVDYSFSLDYSMYNLCNQINPGGFIMEECQKEKHRAFCNCTYEPCTRKLKCCDCLHYHRRSGELPACFFNAEIERTYDRSISAFIKMHKGWLIMKVRNTKSETRNKS